LNGNAKQRGVAFGNFRIAMTVQRRATKGNATTRKGNRHSTNEHKVAQYSAKQRKTAQSSAKWRK
jgi:hypothetical protein